jgi:biotin-dependent carboxylase-like uncharacterized protein
MGAPVSGVLDGFAHRVANWLVGNGAHCAVLEMTFMGAHLEVLDEADIAVTGADMGLTVNGEWAGGWRSVRVRPGDAIRLDVAQNGCRGYLAVTGGVDVPVVMGSRSTCVGGRLGGVEGRPLKEGDVVKRGEGGLLAKPLRLPWIPRYSSGVTLRAIPGPHDEYFTESLDLFFASTFTVSGQANRMGYRLEGPEIPRSSWAPESILSEPVIPGNVQIPAGGRPIILLMEQTMGGYANIATVISPDIFRIAQSKPGDTVRFVRVTIEEAHEVCRQWARYFAEIEALLTASARV